MAKSGIISNKPSIEEWENSFRLLYPYLFEMPSRLARVVNNEKENVPIGELLILSVQNLLTQSRQEVIEEIRKESLELFTKLKKEAEIAGELVFLHEMENQIEHLTPTKD